jgi:hypothetical protein
MVVLSNDSGFGMGAGNGSHFLECCHTPFFEKYGLLHVLQVYVFLNNDGSSVSSVFDGAGSVTVGGAKFGHSAGTVIVVILCFFVSKCSL